MSSVAGSAATPKSTLSRSAKGPIVFKRRKGSLRRRNLVGYVFIAPWLIGFFVFTFIPGLVSLYFAFTSYDTLSSPKWVGLANFERMLFQDPRYWHSVQATFYYVFTAVPLRLLFALAIAMLLNTPRRGVSLYRAIYYAPSVVGGSVAV
ncbi:MAG: sugar ABC transporter permease, partial [Nitrososphaera sp.]|nr:sugar ABC transporter permease [Nitrososphaera sp.]